MIVFNTKSRWTRYKLRWFNVRDKEYTYISRGSSFNHDATIGSGTRINGRIVVKGSNKCVIGKYCAIGDNVRIITSNHGINNVNLQLSLENRIGTGIRLDKASGVLIGHNVWVGDSVIILPNVTIGNGAVIGAGSIVSKNVPAYSVVVGVPAKVMRFRFSKEKIQEIEDLEWWNWSLEKMKESIDFFIKTD